MAKGSKRDRWLKDGIKITRKWYKKFWNRKVRNNTKLNVSGSSYKKIAKDSAYDGVL